MKSTYLDLGLVKKVFFVLVFVLDLCLKNVMFTAPMLIIPYRSNVNFF